MVLGEVWEPKPSPREAPQRYKNSQKPNTQHPGNPILRVSMGCSVFVWGGWVGGLAGVWEGWVV
jgi:hypothetical protein